MKKHEFATPVSMAGVTWERYQTDVQFALFAVWVVVMAFLTSNATIWKLFRKLAAMKKDITVWN